MTWFDSPRRSHVFVAAAAAVFQLMVLPIWRPLNLPDESGFLLNAIRLGTGGAPSGLDYFPGYSTLLAPLTALTTDLETLTRLVQVVNGLLGVVTALLAMQLARRLGEDLTEPALAAIGLVVAAYPAYRLFGAFALSENLLVPWTVGLCLAFERAVRRSTGVDVAVFGLMAGLSFAIHSRAIALTLAGFCAALLVLRGRSLLGALAGQAAGLGTALLLVTYTLDTSVDSGAPRSSPGALLRSALSVRGAADAILSAAGQGFYLLAATAGLGALGLWHLTDAVLSSSRESDSARSVGILAILILATSVGISSLFLAGREGDFAIYGRYGEGVLVPFLVAGLVASASSPATTRDRIWRLCVGLPLLAGALVLVRGPEAFQGRTLLLNIAGVFPVVDVVGSIRLSTLALYGVAAMLVVGLLLRSHFVAGSLVLAAVFLGFGSFAIDRSAAAIDVLDTQDQLITAIEESAVDADCVALDIWQLPDRWHQENYRLRLDQQRFEYWSSATPQPPCSDLIISQRSDLDDLIPGASVIAVEPFGRQALWVLPGARQDVINSQRSTITDPLAAFEADQEIVVDIETPPLSVALGDSFEAVATIENRGPLGLFPEGGFATIEGSTNLGLEFRSLEEPDVRRHEPIRIRIPVAVAKGTAVELSRQLRPEDIDPSIQPGTYLLVASIVQEGIAWTDFADAVMIEVTG